MSEAKPLQSETVEPKSVVHEKSGTVGEVFNLAYPLVISFLSFSIMGIVDTFIVGRLGTAEQGGVGMGQSLTWTVNCFFVGTQTAITTFVSQSYGAGKLDTLNRWVVTALMLVVPWSLIMWMVLPFIPGLVELMGTTEEVRPFVLPYFTIRIWGVPFILINFTLSGFLRGLGDTKTPMIVTVIANLFNAALDVILVFGYGPIPSMGVEGAALASILATIVSATLYFRVYLGSKNATRFGTRQWADISIDSFKQFLKIGIPMGGSWFIESISWAFMTFYIASIDPAGLAAHSIVFQLLHISFMPAAAISVAASTLVGQYLGAERVDLARRSARISIGLGVLFMSINGVAFFLLRYKLISWFNPDPKVIEIGATILIIAASFQIFDALGLSTSGVLRGAGDTRFPLYAQLGAAWFVFIPLIFILGKVFGMGVYGAWIAALVFIILLGGLMVGRYIGGKWERMRVV